MVAQTEEIRYGYSDRDLGNGQYEIVYETPVLRTSASGMSREDDIEAERIRAYDLALWRAAQIALERGYDHIVILNSSSESDVEVQDDPYYPGYGWYGGYYGYGGWPDPYYGRYRYSPFAYAPPYYRRDAYMRISVTILVREATEADVDAIDAQATATRLASQYSNATFPGR